MDHVLVFDECVVPFLLNCHVTPQGLVNIDQPGKKPWCVFDSTFRPTFWAVAINDMTTKDTEPVIREIDAELKLMKWFWALRALYPTLEIYPMDDDGKSAFRQLRYHPDVVAMHTCILLGLGFSFTGGTFGDCTTPANWDTRATARRQLARWFWEHEPRVIEMARPYLPPISTAPPPTPEYIAQFCPAEFDSLNLPPVNPDGTRQPPPYNHQVDDNVYGEVGHLLLKTLSCSALALYVLVGFPNRYIPNLLSKDKLDTFYSHLRQIIGQLWNTRALTVGMLDSKKQHLLALLDGWLVPRKTFTIAEAASLLGQLENHT